MITAELTDDNGTIDMPQIELDFINGLVDKSVDVETLNASVHTDFVPSTNNTWEFNYGVLTKEQYDEIRGYFDRQFTDFQYPLLTIPFYDIDDRPVRMYINEKDIWNNCGDVRNVKITFRETAQLSESS